MKIAGVILAGGLSTRMGSVDKCILELGSKTLLQRSINRLTPQVEMLCINTNSDDHTYHATGLPVIADCFPGFSGPLAGILTGMEWAHENGADHVASVAADTPFFPTDFVSRMTDALKVGGNHIAIAETPDVERVFNNHPTFGLWPTSLRNDLRKALENDIRKVMQWARPHGVQKVAFTNRPFDPFFNINAPADLEKAQNLLKDHGL